LDVDSVPVGTYSKLKIRESGSNMCWALIPEEEFLELAIGD